MSMIPFDKTVITDGFWKAKQQMVLDTSIEAVRARFEDTGRFAAFDFQWKPGDPNKPHIFWDSDIAKWMEGAAYSLRLRPDSQLEAEIDAVVEKILAHQEENGYFNIYFTVVEPEARFTRRTDHELYDAGHLIEAAVAYYEATGKRALLDAMCRYADLIDRVFRVEKSAPADFVTPGHEEIELALVKLYRVTGEKRYLDLACYFVDARGKQSEYEYPGFAKAGYAQDRRPVREETDAIGHAVRAVYLYCAMADLALETGDESLKAACEAVFESISRRRMYITGGIGSSAHGEAFTLDYDLPNLTAYAETCAALGLALFARRMSLLDADSRYADVAERAIYNGFLSGVSLDGRSFFYENPLEIIPRLKNRNETMLNQGIHLPITQRVEVFECSCCPPNVLRFISSIADFLYTRREDTLFVHHYMAAVTQTDQGTVTQQTAYPYEGSIHLTVEDPFVRRVALRIPGWCMERFTLTLNGQKASCRMDKGYAYLEIQGPKAQIDLDLVMEPQVIEANPLVEADSGRCALTCGPLVYCLEAVDNGGNLRDLRIDLAAGFIPGQQADLNLPALYATGWRRPVTDQLYQPVGSRLESQRAVFIPYFAFANRGESEMLVWFLTR
jgi:DUF1680 family protein